jgi:hypothetical protein
VHAYFCPGVNIFLSKSMDVTPATYLGRVRRSIEVILQKSRPYPAKDFVEPIVATTMDEVQLSMAASALQRIHESVPNSQHSEALHWAVWQVAGSPALRIPPLFNLPSWIFDKWDDVEYFSHLSPPMLAALIAVWLRASYSTDTECIDTVRAVLRRVDSPKVYWAQIVIAVLDHKFWTPDDIEHMDQPESDDLTNMIRKKELHKEESLWLLSTLSDLCIMYWWTGQQEPFLIGICLAMLLNHAPKWHDNDPPDIVLLEAVVTLTALSCSSDGAYQSDILTNSRQHPWLLLNIRNPDLITKLLEDSPDSWHEQVVSLLFLVTYALVCRGSNLLAARYFAIINAKGDFPLYTSALTAIAPAIGSPGLSAFGMSLMSPRSPNSILVPYTWLLADTIYPEMFTNYDRQLGSCQNPDRNFVAILLVLSKELVGWARTSLQKGLKNPWLRLAAQLDVPDGSGAVMGSFQDNRVRNMIAALSLLRYTRGMVGQFRESLLLASFLESREWAVSSLALKYYLRTIISYSGPSTPSFYLSHALHAVFNLMLPDHQLRMGWEILEIFVNGFGDLPEEWSRIFAEAFVTQSPQPLPQSRGNTETNTPEEELRKILTWEYFHEREREAKLELTNLQYSGLDWMAMAWLLHLSQPTETMIGGPPPEEAQSWSSQSWSSQPWGSQSWSWIATVVTEEFVLQALCKLLEAAPHYQIIPIIPKLSAFVQWFDDTDFPGYRGRISARIEEALRMQHTFYRFHCMWYI